jgi:hypothetical protein
MALSTTSINSVLDLLHIYRGTYGNTAELQKTSKLNGKRKKKAKHRDERLDYLCECLSLVYLETQLALGVSILFVSFPKSMLPWISSLQISTNFSQLPINCTDRKQCGDPTNWINHSKITAHH